MAIGKKLERLLQIKGVKAGTLATETGISKNTLYAIIKRDSEKVSIATLTKISDALNVSLDYFFDKDIEGLIEEKKDSSEKENQSISDLNEAKLIEIYRSLNDAGKQSLMRQAEMHMTVDEYVVKANASKSSADAAI